MSDTKAATTNDAVATKRLKASQMQRRLRTVRAYSGLVLFVYIFFHYLNHALGLISHEVLLAGGEINKTVWRFLPMTVLLYGALAAHFGTSIYGLAKRRSMRMGLREGAQVLMGLLIPFLLVTHVMGTRYASAAYGLNDDYTYVLLSVFVFSPINGIINAAGLVAAWVHSCIGLYMWFRFKRWYTDRVHQIGLVLATLIPSLALAGYLSAGRRIAPMAQVGEFLEVYYEELNLLSDDVWVWLGDDTAVVRWLLVAAVLALIVIRIVRSISRRRSNELEISYLDGPTIHQRQGPTLLELSNLAHVPHASVCGGRGRCSTCRVQILETTTPLPEPDDTERKVLDRVRAPQDVRLACQVRPQGNMKVIRLLPSDAGVQNARTLEPWSSGREQHVTVMFADLRDFTKTSEAKLPFDVVYLINQFSRSMGKAVEGNGGRIDKFLGDGFMALFGVNSSEKDAARSALAAAGAMIAELKVLNERLAKELDEPLRMGVGLHSGPVILGDMGYGPARGLTAIGDTVNVASRLEAATKSLQCALCVSDDVIKAAGIQAAAGAQQTIEVRGKSTKVSVYGVNHPDELTQGVSA